MEFFMIGAGIAFGGIGLGALILFTAMAIYVFRDAMGWKK